MLIPLLVILFSFLSSPHSDFDAFHLSSDFICLSFFPLKPKLHLSIYPFVLHYFHFCILQFPSIILFSLPFSSPFIISYLFYFPSSMFHILPSPFLPFHPLPPFFLLFSPSLPPHNLPPLPGAYRTPEEPAEAPTPPGSQGIEGVGSVLRRRRRRRRRSGYLHPRGRGG